MTENSQNSNQVKIYSSKEEELEEVKQDKKKMKKKIQVSNQNLVEQNLE
jgi:hypothetical protein